VIPVQGGTRQEKNGRHLRRSSSRNKARHSSTRIKKAPHHLLREDYAPFTERIVYLAHASEYAVVFLSSRSNSGAKRRNFLAFHSDLLSSAVHEIGLSKHIDLGIDRCKCDAARSSARKTLEPLSRSPGAFRYRSNRSYNVAFLYRSYSSRHPIPIVRDLLSSANS